MSATGLKIVGTEACIPWCSISSSFQNSLKTSGNRGYEFLEFWCWNFILFLPDIGFQLLKSLWSSLTYFLFNDGPNVLYRWTIWTAGRPIQHPDSSTTKPCCCFALSCCNTRCLEGSICCSKTFIYLSAFIVPSKKCKRPITYALMHPHTIKRCWLLNWKLITRWKVSLLFSVGIEASVISDKNVKFGLVWP